MFLVYYILAFINTLTTRTIVFWEIDYPDKSLDFVWNMGEEKSKYFMEVDNLLLGWPLIFLSNIAILYSIV